jgi:electron transport complex protein RnfC
MSRQLFDFHGGIHPPENKTQSTQTAIEPCFIPGKLVLPLQQHIGQQSKPLVLPGDRVLKGQMIAASDGYVSAALHAPTSGTVTAITAHALPHPSGLTETCMIIEPDGKDEWGERHAIADYRQADKEILLQQIRDAGITGLGGAGFPTAVKLNPSEDLRIDTLILNAAECEPYITADDMLMRERANEVVAGLQIIAHILQAEQCLIGIEDNKPEAIKALQDVLDAEQQEIPVRVVRIPTKYPSGGEKQLIQILTGKEVPNGGIPADIGIVCQNVGTAVAVYRAVDHGEPLISRITTLTGEALGRQGNIEVLLGTPIKELLSHFEVDPAQLHRLVMGGPMMGFTLTDTDLPVVKATNCILAATRKELPDPAPEQACIRCGMCAEACPASLLPQQLYWFSKSREFDKALSHNLLDCIECGACSYVCPSNIPLVQYYRFAKGEIRHEEHERTASDHARQRFEARQARLEQEEAEKEAKRKARAEAAATAKKAKQTTKDDSAEVDPKAAVIQAALERAQARKAQKAAQTDKPSTDETKSAAMSAVERAKAKKAQQADAKEGAEKPVLSAVERAKARQAAQNQAAQKENNSNAASDGLSALERAKAKRSLNNETASPDEKADKPLSALERAKAKRAQQVATDDSPEAPESVEAEPQATTSTGLSALERAKAKRAAAESDAASGTEAGDQAQPSTGLSALERAKAKRAQAAEQAANQDEPDDKDSAQPKAPGTSALERAKAKRAAQQGEPSEAAEKPMTALERAKAKRAQQASEQAEAASEEAQQATDEEKGD